MTLVIIALISFLSAFVQAASGFGYSIFAMYLMPLFLPFQQCSIISASVIIIIAFQMTFSLHKHIKIKKIIVPMLFCVLTTGIGVYIIRVANQSMMRRIMGTLLIFLSAYFYYTTKHKISMKATFLNSMIIGGLTGIITGMFNIMGPFLSIYYYDNCDDSLEFKANLEFSFLIAGIVSLSLNMIGMKMMPGLLPIIVGAGIAAILAGFLGLKIFYKINKNTLKYIIICVLPIMGIVQILNA